MKKLRIILFVLVGLFAFDAMAQNPKQSKKRKVKAKKSSKKEGEVTNGGHLSAWFTADKDADGIPNGRDK